MAMKITVSFDVLLGRLLTYVSEEHAASIFRVEEEKQ
jgi:hypothetical protein